MSDACYCDYEPAKFYQVEVRKAKRNLRQPAKVKRCSECGVIICAGERYEHVWAMWDDGPCVFNTCPRCLDLREYVIAHVPCFCWYHGDVREEAIETIRNYAHEAPGLLFGALRREVLIRRQRHAN